MKNLLKNLEILHLNLVDLPDLISGIHHPLGLTLLTRLRLGLSHLNEHRFKHNFKNCINPICACSLEVKSTKHFSCTATIIQHSVFLS